ncbi:MAG: hypothetical protein RIT45_3803 [Pseudomonadota bacterium]|jgi:diguanylate cyclase (GGDEF)-like protein
MSRSDHLDAETRITSVKEIAARSASRNACLVQLRGPQMGRRFELGSEPVSIGRDPTSVIVLESDSVSRRHARIDPTDIGHRVVDNYSTNGTYLNDVLVQNEASLRSGDYVQIGEAIFKYLSGDNIELAYHEEIYRLTIEDGLTQIPNKRALVDFLDREFTRARRHGRPLTVIMMDIDHFKRINDEFGHLMGDYVLRELSKLAKARVRHEEMFARYGGEEFCCVMPETALDGGVSFGEDFRRLVEEHRFEFEGNRVNVTISVGVATVDDSMTRAEAAVLAADENLYRAKRGGRNRVVS